MGNVCDFKGDFCVHVTLKVEIKLFCVVTRRVEFCNHEHII